MKSSNSINSSPIIVGFDAKRYFNNSTGLGNYARWLIDDLSSQSIPTIKPILFTTTGNQANDSQIVIKPKGLWKYLKWLWRINGINQSLKQNDINIYHGLSNELPFGIHRTNIKTVVTIHDLINLRYPENYGVFDRWVYKQKLKYAQRHADLIITPSLQTKQDLIHYFGTKSKKIRVIPLSIPPLPNFNQTEEKEYILCISSFNKRKNLTNLVNAYQQLEVIKPRLIIAGKIGEQYPKLKKLVDGSKRIKLIPNPTTEQIHSLYNSAEFCVYPSLFEGFGIPILEAFAHRKVVATSNTSSMPEVGGNTAAYFNPLDISEIQNTIQYLCNPKNRIKHESNIEKQLERFESVTLINKYVSCYQSLYKSS